MKKKKSEAPKTEKPITREDPPYIKAFNSKPSNRKVGQTFVTSTKQLLPKKKDS
jgi:hypothetical protein